MGPTDKVRDKEDVVLHPLPTSLLNSNTAQAKSLVLPLAETMDWAAFPRSTSSLTSALPRGWR